uniref:Uncharacterized protein n=1 Tax=Timema bartmani TaxID=61472 RepID=A0A7R9ER40_9NEOP|nr:unnamed protein product [Timema bartmani]
MVKMISRSLETGIVPDNMKIAKGDVKADRRNKGIVPALPLPEDRARVKEEFLEKRRQEKEIALEKRQQLPPGCRATLFDKLNHLAGSLEGSVRGNPRDASSMHT